MDSSGIAPFDETNFQMWKCRVMARLDALGVKEVVEGNENPIDDLAELAFYKHNAKAKDTILRFIADSHLEYVINEDTA